MYSIQNSQIYTVLNCVLMPDENATPLSDNERERENRERERQRDGLCSFTLILLFLHMCVVCM